MSKYIDFANMNFAKLTRIKTYAHDYHDLQYFSLSKIYNILRISLVDICIGVGL